MVILMVYSGDFSVNMKVEYNSYSIICKCFDTFLDIARRWIYTFSHYILLRKVVLLISD